MLCLHIPERELFDERTSEFHVIKPIDLELEHSLVSISRWESKWHKPLIKCKDLTPEQNIDYIRCMTLNRHVDPYVYHSFTNEEIKKISDYIADPMTATWFSDDKKPSHNSEAITSELIYYWMTVYNIPSEYQKWHINRLLTLIKICNVKSQKPKKMSKREILSHNAALNKARRAKLGTKG